MTISKFQSLLLKGQLQNRLEPASTQAMTIDRHLSANDLKLKAPGNLTPEQKAKWDSAYGPKNEAFEKANLEGDDLFKWKYQRYVKDYLRCIDSVDENIGRLLDYLDKEGLADNTVVIYSSDQGWYLGEHGWYDKRGCTKNVPYASYCSMVWSNQSGQ